MEFWQTLVLPIVVAVVTPLSLLWQGHVQYKRDEEREKRLEQQRQREAAVEQAASRMTESRAPLARLVNAAHAYRADRSTYFMRLQSVSLGMDDVVNDALRMRPTQAFTALEEFELAYGLALLSLPEQSSVEGAVRQLRNAVDGTEAMLVNGSTHTVLAANLAWSDLDTAIGWVTESARQHIELLRQGAVFAPPSRVQTHGP